VQRLILNAETVIWREPEVAKPIPQVVEAVQYCTNMNKEVFS
jgi:hypothetical protein